MRRWKEIVIPPATSIRDALRIIDSGSVQIALVAAPDLRLLGTVTDGDVRRGILRNVALDAPVEEIMNETPITIRTADATAEALATMKARRLRQIPVLDSGGHLVDVVLLEDLLGGAERPNIVVLMAGGAGTRLRPLTDDCPKPLLKVGDKPLLETILESFIDHGFRRFYISVNYKAEMVKEYFSDGSRWGVEIAYLQEDTRMGTAGCLSLLPQRPEHPFIVMNGDLLTKVNFAQLLEFHSEHHAIATVCVREYDLQVPYGVVKLDRHRLTGIDEKPVHKFFVNAGVYVLQPEALAYVEPNTTVDMPSLLQLATDGGGEVSAFPIREYWLDIGRLDDLERAKEEFSDVFRARSLELPLP